MDIIGLNTFLSQNKENIIKFKRQDSTYIWTTKIDDIETETHMDISSDIFLDNFKYLFFDDIDEKIINICDKIKTRDLQSIAYFLHYSKFTDPMILIDILPIKLEDMQQAIIYLISKHIDFFSKDGEKIESIAKLCKDIKEHILPNIHFTLEIYTIINIYLGRVLRFSKTIKKVDF